MISKNNPMNRGLGDRTLSTQLRYTAVVLVGQTIQTWSSTLEWDYSLFISRTYQYTATRNQVRMSLFCVVGNRDKPKSSIWR